MYRKHYHLMNGFIGCLPDNNEIYHSFKSAYDSAKELFPEMNRSAKHDLREYGIVYADDTNNVIGAEYIEISGPCYDKECLDENYY